MSNVVNLFDKNRKPKKNEDSDPEQDYSFEEAMKRNEENRKRMEKERKKANRGVTRSYRLKH